MVPRMCMSWWSVLVIALTSASDVHAQSPAAHGVERFTSVDVWTGSYSCEYAFDGKVKYGVPVMLGTPPKPVQLYAATSIHDTATGTVTLQRAEGTPGQVHWACVQETGNGTHTTQQHLTIPGGTEQMLRIQSTGRAPDEGEAPPDEEGPNCGRLTIDLEARTFHFSCPGFTLDATQTEEARIGHLRPEPERSTTTVDAKTCDVEAAPLPSVGNTLSGTFEQRVPMNPPLGMPFDDKLRCSISLQPGATSRPKLKAVAKAEAAAVERGGTVVLDGSASAPSDRIRSWEWRFTPDPACGDTAPSPGLRREAKTTVRALCPFTATLTVSDGTQTASGSVKVQVTPRAWKTEIREDDPEVKDLPGPEGKVPYVEFDKDGKFELGAAAGANVCAVEEPTGLDAISHRLHPDPFGKDLDGEAFTLAQVNDPGGPFHGWWYVETYKVLMHRRSLLNKYFRKDGPTPVKWVSRNIYAHNLYLRTLPKKHTKAAEAPKAPLTEEYLDTDFEGYLAAVLDHEGGSRVYRGKRVLGHSERMKRALRADDPARQVEAMFVAPSGASGPGATERQREQLVARLKERLIAAEHHICTKSGDPLPLSWLGTIALPKADGNFVGVHIPVGESSLQKAAYTTHCPR